MAITKIDFPTPSTPSYTPSIATDYNSQNENIEYIVKNKNDVSLSNWDATTTAPQVLQGSIIESDGVMYRAGSDETISTTGASSGTVYLVFDFSVPEYKWTSTAPAWSATYNGWYVGVDRFTGHICTWDGASAFSAKKQYFNDKRGGDQATIGPAGLDVLSGTLTIEDLSITDNSIWAGTYGSQTITTGTSWVIPAGAYMMTHEQASDNIVILQIYTGSAWVPTTPDFEDGKATGFVVSDGVNYRLIAFNGGCTVHYRKIW